MASLLQYLHGVDIIEIDEGLDQIRTLRSAVIGLVGTAGKGPVNTPVLIIGSRQDAQRIFGKAQDDGFTIPAALDAIFDQGGATVVVVNVLNASENTVEDESAEVTLSPTTGYLPHGFLTDAEIDGTVVKGYDLCQYLHHGRLDGWP